MKLKSAFIVICLSLSICLASAQYRAPQSNSANRPNSSSNFRDNIYFGGGGSFNAQQNYLNIGITPIIGYKITNEFSAGVQLTYQFVKIFETKIKNYGGGPFLRYNVTEKFFGYTEYEYLNFGFVGPQGIERLDFYSWFVGIGYSEPVGDRVSFNITALYNVLYGDGSNSPYASPFVFRAGVVFGL